MPTAREALLDAAVSALAALPWSGVRMVDVASAAGVSRQTLYNEFGSKEGLARALVRREADIYLRGVDRVLADHAVPADRLVALVEWTVGSARSSALIRALLTGCWGERLPAPRPGRTPGAHSPVPAQRRADAGVPGPSELVATVRDRSLAALEKELPAVDPVEVARCCETVVRLALSYVVAPDPARPGTPGGGHAAHVRAVLARTPIRPAP
ncbi:TetR/AcrR family transcriptional regulator [Streptomyces sp. CBMA152]|uniref:TetR/AcrR family transcriptional regulator n=1 Tax=Streptomyces sp. CBMA152 TaxID=1896312 RepID=UPI0016606DC2|nr:TetR/AcrR family transcriptional regulator [Streptomyces sp. CBMA152]MBD0745146.1 TetR family transcriptional regulator [Streptomyces sp. CBMA152]